MRFPLTVGLLVVSLAWVPSAHGHSLLVTPQPRDQQDGYKDPPRAPPGTGAPCGIGRMSPPQPQTMYTAGQPLTVQWRETIDHPGCFVIDFAAAGDAGFQILGVKSHSGAAGNTPRAWSLDVTLPAAAAAAGTLRLRQLMLPADVPDSGCPPATIPTGDTYYSCANVVLAAGAGTTGAGGAGGDGVTGGSGGSTGGGTGGSAAGGSSGAGTGTGGGGGCGYTGHGRGALWASLALLAAMFVSRRRRG